MNSKIASSLVRFVLLACAFSPAAGCSPHETIRLGAVMDLTGSLSAIGPQIRDGVVLAVNQLNQAGGIGGKRVELRVEDGQTDPVANLVAVKKLVEVDGCKVIIGPMTSGAVLASADYALQKKVLLISPLSSSADIAAQPFRQFVFRTSPSDALQGQCMANMVVDGGYKRVSILAINNDYGVGFVKVIKSALANKANIVASVLYDQSSLDYLSELQQIKDSKADCVIHVGYVVDADIIYKQALQLGLSSPRWIASVGVYTQATLAVREAAEFMASCVVGTRPTNPESSPAYRDFASAYQAAFHSTPGVYSGNAYDAANLSFAAMKNVGISDAAQIAAEVLRLSNGYVGASGLLTMSATGDRVSGDFEVWKVVKDASSFSFAGMGVVSLS